MFSGVIRGYRNGILAVVENIEELTERELFCSLMSTHACIRMANILVKCVLVSLRNYSVVVYCYLGVYS